VQACGVQTAVHYTATFVDQNGANLTQYYVSFDSIKTYPQSPTINVTLPVNKIVTRKVYVLSACGGYVLADSTQIGPFTSDFNAGTIGVTLPQTNSFTISGVVKDCNNNAVVSGYAAAQVDGKNFTSQISNGSFTIPISRCSTNATLASVIVIDNANQQTNSSPITVSVMNTNVSVGTVQACGINLTEFLLTPLMVLLIIQTLYKHISKMGVHI